MLPNPPEGPEKVAEGFQAFPTIMEAHTACATAMREGKLPRGCWIKGTYYPGVQMAAFHPGARRKPEETPFGESPESPDAG
jgi:hypothetical protein